jgi:transcriptional regulator with XRE-family HTH domain
MKNSEKKEWAKLLYTREPVKITQKEVAERVGVSQRTMSLWVRNENWDRVRESVIVTKEEQLRRIYMQIEELNNDIFSSEPGKRFASSKQADTLNKLATAAKKLETEASIADIIEVSKRFLNWLRQTDFEKAKEISYFFDAFIKDTIK